MALSPSPLPPSPLAPSPRSHSPWVVLGVISLAGLPFLALATPETPEEPSRPRTPPGEEEHCPAPPPPDLALGEALFLHTWSENDPLSRSGNGLGPVFNDRSCVACHTQGGPGGAGPLAKNVVVEDGQVVARSERDGLQDGKVRRGRSKPDRLRVGTVVTVRTHDAQLATSALRALGIGGPQGHVSNVFTSGPSRSGRGRSSSTSSARTRSAPPRPPPRTVVFDRLFDEPADRGERNTPALFGIGLLDQIPDATLIQLAADQRKAGRVSGRVSILDDGRVGRFGWKAEVAHLDDFVSQACAVEVGLTVPERAETSLAKAKESPGLDLEEHDVTSLTAWVAALPAPAALVVNDTARHGRELFARIGCMECHVEDLGGVSGVYSDLLLHDLGDSLEDSGSFYGAQQPRVAREWRTPPLWGVADSGPWMHDGRASSLKEAVSLHRAEGSTSRRAFFRLGARDRAAVLGFLESLVAPLPTRQQEAGPEDRAPADEELLTL